MKSPLDAALSDQPASEAVAELPVEAPAQAAPAVEAQPETPPPSEAPARGPDGRFAPKVEAPQAPTPPEPGHVPLSAMLDEREKRQAAERRLKDIEGNLERQRAEWRAANPPTEAQALEAQRYADNLRFSRRFAEKEYGKDFIATVHDWALARCDADPHFNERMRASDDPYEAATQAYNREQVLAAVSPADLEAFNAWKAANAQLGQASATPTPHPTPASAPPRSLATAPGNGAAGSNPVNVGEGEAFRAAIG